MHPGRFLHPRLIAVALVLAVLAGPAAARPHCLRDSCAQHLLRRAKRCFDPGGRCVRDDPAGITCWENGARSTTTNSPGGDAERTVYVNAGGRLCQTVTAVTTPTGFQRTTHARGRRRVVFRTTALGLRVTCPGGRVERYSRADLAAPECAEPVSPPTCDPGRCD